MKLSKKAWLLVIPLILLILGFIIWNKQKGPASLTNQTKAQIAFYSFINSKLNKNYLPDDKITLTQKSPSASFEGNWKKVLTKDNANFYSKVFLKDNNVSRFELTINPANLSEATMSGKLTSSLIQKYFKLDSNNIYSCGKSGKVTFCENFTNSQVVKTGIGATSIGNGQVFVFYCSIYKDDPGFNKSKSCLIYNK